MNSENRLNRLFFLGLLATAISLHVAIPGALGSPTAPEDAPVAVSEPAASPAPSPTNAEVGKGEPDSPPLAETREDEQASVPDVAALPEADPQMSAQQVIEMLRSGNNNKPLSVTQLAAINDMLKRMEFLSAVEDKMRQMSLGAVVPTNRPAPIASSPLSRPSGMAAPVTSSARAGGGDQPTVVRVIGAAGRYSAVLSTSSGFITVREGDETSIGPVRQITLSGVTVQSEDGLTQLMFAGAAGSSLISSR